MESKLKELRELIFKCEEVKKDVNNKVETLYRCNRIWDAWNIGTMTEEDFEEVEIYRDINLEDVLRAWECKLKVYWGDRVSLRNVGLNPELEKIILNWIYGKTLQFQSEECIDSLINLLK